MKYKNLEVATKYNFLYFSISGYLLLSSFCDYNGFSSFFLYVEESSMELYFVLLFNTIQSSTLCLGHMELYRLRAIY